MGKIVTTSLRFSQAFEVINTHRKDLQQKILKNIIDTQNAGRFYKGGNMKKCGVNGGKW